MDESGQAGPTGVDYAISALLALLQFVCILIVVNSEALRYANFDFDHAVSSGNGAYSSRIAPKIPKRRETDRKYVPTEPFWCKWC